MTHCSRSCVFLCSLDRNGRGKGKTKLPEFKWPVNQRSHPGALKANQNDFMKSHLDVQCNWLSHPNKNSKMYQSNFIFAYRYFNIEGFSLKCHSLELSSGSKIHLTHWPNFTWSVAKRLCLFHLLSMGRLTNGQMGGFSAGQADVWHGCAECLGWSGRFLDIYGRAWMCFRLLKRPWIWRLFPHLAWRRLEFVEKCFILDCLEWGFGAISVECSAISCQSINTALFGNFFCFPFPPFKEVWTTFLNILSSPGDFFSLGRGSSWANLMQACHHWLHQRAIYCALEKIFFMFIFPSFVDSWLPYFRRPIQQQTLPPQVSLSTFCTWDWRVLFFPLTDSWKVYPS